MRISFFLRYHAIAISFRIGLHLVVESIVYCFFFIYTVEYIKNLRFIIQPFDKITIVRIQANTHTVPPCFAAQNYQHRIACG